MKNIVLMMASFLFLNSFEAFPNLTLDSKIVKIIRGTGVQLKTKEKIAQIEEGQQVNYGEIVKTGNKASLMIEYPSKSQLWLGRNTECSFDDRVKNSEWLRLKKGFIQIAGHPSNSQEAAFIVKTHSLVLAVSAGSKIVLFAENRPDKSKVFVLEGSIEASRNGVSQIGHGGLKLAKGERLFADVNGFSTVRPFTQEEINEIFKLSSLFVDERSKDWKE